MDGRASAPAAPAGRDFFTTIRGMRSTVQTRAKALDMAVAMVSERDARRRAGPELSLCIQFFPERAYRDGPPPMT